MEAMQMRRTSDAYLRFEHQYMTCSPIKRAATILVMSTAWFFLMSSGWQRADAYLQRLIADGRSPILSSTAEFLEPDAQPGAFVTLRSKRLRTRACPGVVHQYWTDNVDFAQRRTVIQQQDVPASPDYQLGELETDFIKRVPAAAVPGRMWYFYVRAEYYCDGALVPIHVDSKPTGIMVR